MSGNNVWIDESPVAQVISFSGNPMQVSICPNDPAEGVPYDPLIHGASTYFNGSTDFLTVPASTEYDFGTGDFTIEFWINPTSHAGSRSVFSSATPDNTNNWHIYSASNEMRFGNPSFYISLGTATPNVWTHFAISRTGTVLRSYRNGSFQNLRNAADILITGGGLRFGQQGAISYFTGFLGGIRIVKGVGLYPSGSSFTPDYFFGAVSGTVFLLNHANLGIFDSACKSRIRLRGATRNTSNFKYGDGSLQADSNGTFGENVALEGYLQTALGSSDFTFEGWIFNPFIDTRVRQIIGVGPRFGVGGVNLCLESNGKLGLYLNGTRILLSSNSMTSGWNHWAASRQGNTYRVFIGGVIGGSTTHSGFNNTDTFFEIGGGGDYNGLNTQLDDIRIMRTIARYIDSFTPPTSPLPKA